MLSNKALFETGSRVALAGLKLTSTLVWLQIHRKLSVFNSWVLRL